MSPEDAIKWVDDRMRLGRFMQCNNTSHKFVYDECCIAGEMAIQAMTKYYIGITPTCQEPIDFGLGNAGKCECGADVNYQFKYCPQCAKKLDWNGDNK